MPLRRPSLVCLVVALATLPWAAAAQTGPAPRTKPNLERRPDAAQQALRSKLPFAICAD